MGRNHRSEGLSYLPYKQYEAEAKRVKDEVVNSALKSAKLKKHFETTRNLLNGMGAEYRYPNENACHRIASVLQTQIKGEIGDSEDIQFELQVRKNHNSAGYTVMLRIWTDYLA